MYCLQLPPQLVGRKTKKLSHRASRNKHKNTCTFLMVLCNSQREEGVILSQICQTSNRVIPQNYKYLFEPFIQFSVIYYNLRLKKLQVCRTMWTLNFDAICVEVVFENITSVCDKVNQNWNLGNVQNERVAIIARWCSKGIGDVAPTSEWAKVVNRALFTLLANLWTCTGLHCLPICESIK